MNDFALKEKITTNDFYGDEVTFDFGNKEKNPLDSIMFFSKPSGDEEPEAKRIKLDEVSSFLPKIFLEKFMRVYTGKILSGLLKELKSSFCCFIYIHALLLLA